MREAAHIKAAQETRRGTIVAASAEESAAVPSEVEALIEKANLVRKRYETFCAFVQLRLKSRRLGF